MEYGAPEQKCHVPCTRYPPGTGSASASWKAKLAGATKCPSPKISSWASSEKYEATWSAWPEPRQSIQPVEGQPRAIDVITR